MDLRLQRATPADIDFVLTAESARKAAPFVCSWSRARAIVVEGLLREALRHRGAFKSLVVLSILDREWAARRGGVSS